MAETIMGLLVTHKIEVDLPREAERCCEPAT